MAKVYDKKNDKLAWSYSEIICPLEDAWFEVLDVLNTNKLDGHDIDDQWLMKVELRMKDLLDTLSEKEYNLDEELNRVVVF
jgi:hypothetical protein